MSVETLDFRMHPKLLLDIIQKQAGGLDKAILEAVMNGIEAGGTRIDIEFIIDGEVMTLIITDNGRGIQTRHELEEHFRKFGTPHEASENKTWAQFRMGRGQCFAQGKNTWRTAGWKMETDINADVAADRLPQFKLTKADNFNGCRIEIELYKGKWHGGVERLKAYVKEQIEFVDVDVYFNGEKINRSPKTCNWTHETDDAYFLFGVGQDLIVYNLGVKCQKIPASRAGVVGVVVSKKQLRVNFARNEVLHDCPVMENINVIVKANRVKKTRKQAKRLDAYERVAALGDLRDGIQSYDDLKNVGLFYTTSGRSLTFRDILNNPLPWSFAAHGDVIADKLMQAGQALVIDRRQLDELSYTGSDKGFFAWLTRAERYGPKWDKVERMYRPYHDLRSNFNETATFVPPQKWTKVEKRLVRVLEGFDIWGGRRIVIGLADAYNAWTDGQSFIALERGFVRRHHLTCAASSASFFAVMIHELAHTERTNGTHVHGEEFYRNFHNLVVYGNVAGTDQYVGGGAFRYIEAFCARMKNAVNEERAEAAQKREKKAKDRVDKALNGGKTTAPVKVAASPKTPTSPTTSKTPTKRKSVLKRGRVVRRMPSGAE